MADWAGEFGDEYTERNAAIPPRDTFWNEVLPKDATTVLEIGCNFGANLKAIQRARSIMTAGVEINAKAAQQARDDGLIVYTHNALEYMPGIQAWLTFTVGVLIHLNSPDVISMMKVLRSHSMRYVLFAEYYAEVDEEVTYRGVKGALYRRPFGKIYKVLFPEDVLIGTGKAGPELGFDNITWWLYDRGNYPSESRK